MIAELKDRQWIVLLEVADAGSTTTIDHCSFARLVAAWTGPALTTLYSPRRYALQVPVLAADPSSAILETMEMWKAAVRLAGLPLWSLVRAEIVTPEELECELEAAQRSTYNMELAQWRSAAQHDAEEDLLRRALWDPISGLPEREIFLEVVRRALASEQRRTSLPVTIAVHLDPTSPAEELDGARPGNVVLTAVARGLQDVVRGTDTVARVGPAEFALQVEVPSAEHADAVATRIVDAVRHARTPEGAPATASVGVAISSRGDDADDALDRAGLAAVVARVAGGDCHRQLAVTLGEP